VGEAYLFRYLVAGDLFQDLGTLSASSPAAGDRFGTSIAVNGLLVKSDTAAQGIPAVAVGVPGRDGATSDEGGVDVFTLLLTPAVELTSASGSPAGGAFGTSVAIGDRIVAGGAPADGALGASAGAATTYFTTPNQLVYGAGKVNSEGCTPQMVQATGIPSLSQPTPFTIGAVGVLQNKTGLVIYGFAQASMPFMGGTLLVSPPIRTPIVIDDGNPSSTCLNTIFSDIGASLRSNPNVVPGMSIYVQWDLRDPGDPDGVSLSNAMTFRMVP
jgi:hypothetical protein